MNIWQTAEWKERKKKFLGTITKCSWCGSIKGPFIPHHYIKYPTHYRKYLEFEDVVAICKKCHFLYETQGLTPCLTCGKYTRFIHYEDCQKKGKIDSFDFWDTSIGELKRQRAKSTDIEEYEENIKKYIG